jgi:cytochrome c peroxidase
VRYLLADACLLFENKFITSLLTVCILISTCATAASLQELKTLYERPNSIPFPVSNPYSAEKTALGKMLFFDPRLSRNKNMNCATCHNPSFGWEDATRTSVGSQNTHLSRHSPTIINSAWGKSFFWDGRAKTLEEQAQGPIESNVEMNISLPEVTQRLKTVDKYQTLITRVFGATGITGENIKKAIATFERTIVSGEAPFDKWIKGDDTAISTSAIRGFDLFNNKAQCSQCHTGWNFTDNEFHDIALIGNDKGLGDLNKKSTDNFAFKTPGLRNISQRAPYMHDGRFDQLSMVIAHYNVGLVDRATRSKKLKNINLTKQEIADLTEFLLTLTGSDTAVTLPILPY